MLKLVIYDKLQLYKGENMENFKDTISKKYLLPGKTYKNYMKEVLTREGILAPYSIEYNGADVIEKVYFDTVDRFFFNNGILIYLIKNKNSKMAKIIVRYEGEDKRIPFISEMPTILAKEISKKDFFSAHFDFMVEALMAIMPAGLGVDLPTYINTIIPVFVVVKKAQQYRIVHNSGLKMTFSFEEVDYMNNANRNKQVINQLEIILESTEKEESFEKFIKRLILQVPTILPMKHSDILNGLDYTSKTDEKPADKKIPKK